MTAIPPMYDPRPHLESAKDALTTSVAFATSRGENTPRIPASPFVDGVEEIRGQIDALIRLVDNAERGVVIYEGSFELEWLRDDERVMSAGDGSGACIVVDGAGVSRRIDIGDEISLPVLFPVSEGG